MKDSYCVAMASDKYTIKQKTVDILTLITVVPGSHPNKMFQNVFVGAPVTKSVTGIGDLQFR